MNINSLIYKFFKNGERNIEMYGQLFEELNKIAFFERTFSIFEKRYD